MAEDNSGVKFILENRVQFLHQIQKTSMHQGDTERKRIMGLQAIHSLFNTALALQLSENDLPDQETRNIRNLFIIDGYLASGLREDLSINLYELSEYRKDMIEQFYKDVVEIVDRALIRYETMFDRASLSSKKK